MKAALLVAAATAALAMPAGAASASQGPSGPRPVDWLPKFERAAAGYWGHGQPPTCGAISYAWAPVTLPGHNPAAIMDAPCHITFDVDQWHAEDIPTKCMVVFHEIGHVYGRQHTPHGVMAPNIVAQGDWTHFRPCHDLIRTVVTWKHLRPGVAAASYNYVPR